MDVSLWDQMDKEALGLIALGVGGCVVSDLLYKQEEKKEIPSSLVLSTVKATKLASIAIMGLGVLHPLVQSQYGVISLLDELGDVLDGPILDDDD